jgi:molybdopterin converting factor subunit 1
VRVRLRLFATLREQLGPSIERDVPRGTTVGGVWDAVVAERPALGRVPVKFAVGERYVERSHRVKAGDEVAVFPPVSGGA